jgi:integrase/recombinase XerD
MSEENMYKRGETWWLRASVAGVEYRESLRTSDVKRARRLRDERLDSIKAEVHHGERRRGWHEAVTEWITHAKGTISQNTLKRYAVSLKQCEPCLSSSAIGTIDGKTIGSLIQARRLAGATPATINRDLTAVSRVCEYAEAMGWREGNPTLDKRRLNRERRDPIYLPDEASYRMVAGACSIEFYHMIEAARLTGLRQAELASAKWSHLDHAAETLEVVGKGNKRRTIKLSDEALFAILGTRHHGEFIFSKRDGTPFTKPAQDFAHFRRKVDGKPGFKRFRFHDLRHLFAVEALRSGMGIYALSKHLGHTSVKTTEIYLSFLTGDEANQAMAAGGTVVTAGLGLAQKTAQRFLTEAAQ